MQFYEFDLKSTVRHGHHFKIISLLLFSNLTNICCRKKRNNDILVLIKNDLYIFKQKNTENQEGFFYYFYKYLSRFDHSENTNINKYTISYTLLFKYIFKLHIGVSKDKMGPVDVKIFFINSAKSFFLNL